MTQYSTSIPPEARNVGTYFMISAMSETEIKRFREVTVHSSSRLITRMPRATSFIFSPYWYPEPFFIRHRKILKSILIVLNFSSFTTFQEDFPPFLETESCQTFALKLL